MSRTIRQFPCDSLSRDGDRRAPKRVVWVLAKQKHQSTVVEDNPETTVAEATGHQAPMEAAIRASKEIVRLPKIRNKKVLAIRQQLAKGKYDLDERLNLTLEKLIGDLVEKESPEK